MQAKPGYYRDQTKKSRELAQRCEDPDTRLHLLGVAEQYEVLADKAERR